MSKTLLYDSFNVITILTLFQKEAHGSDFEIQTRDHEMILTLTLT